MIAELLGKTITEIKISDEKDEVLISTSNGEKYRMAHQQDCCECVEVYDIVGDINDLLDSPILMAEETTNSDSCPDGVDPDVTDESFTWTFYKFATAKGYVTIRWLGGSNGYYSEDVDFELINAAPVERNVTE